MIVARKALVALFFAYALPASAQDRVAILVTSESDQSAPTAAQPDILALSETLFGMGFVVSRLQNPDDAALNAAFAALPPDATALFYFRGPADADEGEAVLVSGGSRIPLDPAIARLQGAGRPETLVFLDTCGTFSVPLPTPDDVLDLFVAMSTAPGAACPADSASLAR